MSPECFLRWHDEAVRDLERAHAFLLERNPEAARRFARRVLEAAESLRVSPGMGPVAQDVSPQGRYRSWTLGRYRLIYRVDGRTIWILRVWDNRRNPEDLSAPD
jgi:plasmid stabilization system protein ParE